ncbi:uncharacterized protein LOC126368635 [Pectinophora gossypiella]|nr:uncharacterized protein LOC126368635 [Pectinophora gossypiella]
MIVLYILCILSCSFIVECKKFRADYKYHKEVDGWLKLHQVPANWFDARLRCTMEGATLASPLNLNMMSTMSSVMKGKVNTVFTGIHAIFSRGDFYSIEGVPLSRIPASWEPNEPDNQDDSESCIVMRRNERVADVRCSDVYHYICYKKNDPNMNGQNECGTTDHGYKLDQRTNQCYKFHNLGQTWSRAFMTCSAEGAYLAIINSEIEASVLKDLYGKFPDGVIYAKHKGIAAIGFHDWHERASNVWITIHGQTLKEAGYSTFEQNQPDNATTGEFCGSIFRSARLNDLWCNDPVPFICEMTPGTLFDSEG